MAKKQGLTRAVIVAVCILISSQRSSAEQAISSLDMDVKSLCQLVDKRAVLKLKYRGDPEIGGIRTVHPYAVGFTPSKNVLIFGLQVGGHSKSAESDNAKGWRNFRTDRIVSLTAEKGSFEVVRPHFPDNKIIADYACKNSSVQ